jgi:hypothetical protein
VARVKTLTFLPPRRLVTSPPAVAQSLIRFVCMIGSHAMSDDPGPEHERHHQVHNSCLVNTSGLAEGQSGARSPPPEMRVNAGPESRPALAARWLQGRAAVATPLRGEQPATVPAEVASAFRLFYPPAHPGMSWWIFLHVHARGGGRRSIHEPGERR